MCGIVGLVTKTNSGFTRSVEDIFTQMVYANTLRGDDSTGVIAIEKDTTFHVAKEASAGYWFLPNYDATKTSKAMWSRGKAIIGHNRKKTIGKVSDETAHPFVENEEFAMVHNGTLYNHRTLADTEVDSQALTKVLAAAFEKEDYVPTLEETLGKVNGAYAVAMYDQRHHKLRLLRNKERPLSIVETADAFYFASEGAMLFWILGRNGVSFKDVKINLIPEHTVVEIDLDTNKMTQQEVTPKKPLPPVTMVNTGTGGNTKANTIKFKPKTTEGLSKNAFKRFRKQYLNKTIEWWSEDYIESNFPKTEMDGETVFTVTGVSDSIGEDHLVKATVDLKDTKFPRGKDLCDRLWTGKVAEMSYERRARKMVFFLENAKAVPLSKTKKAKSIIPKKDEYDSVICTVNDFGEPCKQYFLNMVKIAELTFVELNENEKETQPTVH